MKLALALVIGATAGVVAATQPISDTDLWWHLATGRETLMHGFVRSDLFSWTVRGLPVSTDQWLGQIALYAAYTVLGWWGVGAVRVIAVTALIALVLWNASLGRSARPLVVVTAALPAFIETRVLWVDRPELLGLVCFAALLPLLRRGDTRSLIACVALIAIWANLHGSFALGVVLVVLVMIERAVSDPGRRPTYAAVTVATLVASVLTPAGIGTWTAPGFHLLSPPRDIQEWALIDPATPLGVAYILTLALLLLALVRGPRPSARDLVILVPVALLSLTAVRQAPLLAIAAAPIFAGALDARLPSRVPTTRAPAVLFAVAALLLFTALLVAPRDPNESAYPVGALNSLPNGDGTLARYEWGGWLIWRAPATPVFVDGRLTPYLGGVIDDYRRIISAAPGWEDIVARRQVRTLLVTPTDPVATRAQQLGWRVVARSSLFVIIAVP